jgi:enoyl-CoA hydratase
MSPELIEALPDIVEAIRANPDVRAVVVTGAGRAFSAGADFRTLAGLIESSGLEGIAGVHAGITGLYAAFLPIAEIEVPVIAAINGHAVGGGLGIALLADIRIISEDAKIGANFSRLGIHPGLGISHRLIRAVGHEAASELLFTGRLIRGREAAQIGLCRRAVPTIEVLSTATALAQEIAESAPLAVRAIKKTLRTAGDEDIESVLQREAMAQAILTQTQDAAEGIQAQMARRTPEFKGR